MSNTSSPLKLAWRIGVPRYEADKTFETGRQMVDLPATVTDRQYELENFPVDGTLSRKISIPGSCSSC